MHPTISYRLAQARIAELQRQALRDALAHTASRTRPPRTPMAILIQAPGTARRRPGLVDLP